MFLLKSLLAQEKKTRQKRGRSRTLRLESLDRREMMDGYGIGPVLPSGVLGDLGNQPASYAGSYSTQSSNILVPGSVRGESLSQSGEIDRFIVQATENQKFQISISTTAGLDAQIRVLDPSGRLIVNSSTTNAIAPEFIAAKVGNYLVEVRARNGSAVGTYRLGLESLSKPSEDVKTIIAGNVANGRLTGTIQADQYKVTAQAGQVFQVAMATEKGWDGWLRVFAPGGQMLVNTSTNTAVNPNFTANGAGEYVVQVQARNLISTGAYRVGVESLSTPSRDARSLPIGSVADGRLAGTVQTDQYKVTARAGQVFQVAMATQGTFDGWLRVFAPGGRILVNTSTSTAVNPNFTANGAGEYIVQVQARNLISTGAYRVGLESLSTPSLDAKNLVIGSVAEGQMTAPIQTDQYKVTARAGQVFQVAMATQGTFDGWLRVFAPGGRILVNTSTSTAVNPNFTANGAGEYIVQVQARNLISTGAYRVGVESLSTPSPDAKNLVIGSVADGQVTAPIQTDQYKVTAGAGQVFQVAMATQGTFDGWLRVFAPGGQMLVNTSTTTAVNPNFTADVAGEYIVQVQARNLISTGAYRVGVESLSTPSPDAKNLVIGSVAEGQVTAPIQTDQYKVTAQAGQLFQVAMATQQGWDGWVRVFAPGGQMLVNTSTRTAVTPQFRAAVAGEYVISIQARNLTAVGSYRVGIESLTTPSNDARALAVGSSVNGQLLGTVQADQYKFLANSGQRFQFDLTPYDSLNMRVRVFSSSGQTLVNTTVNSARTLDFTATDNGEFIVMIEAANSLNQGRYRIGLRLRA